MEANPEAKRLYDDLLSNYNRLIRPVVNNTETLTVWLGLKLSQLIEVNLKNQVIDGDLQMGRRMGPLLALALRISFDHDETLFLRRYSNATEYSPFIPSPTR